MSEMEKQDNFKAIKDEYLTPSLNELFQKEYNLDSEIIDALRILDDNWKSLNIPVEYEEALKSMECDNYSYSDILKILPFTYAFIFVAKLVTYLSGKNEVYDSEISLLFSLMDINSDLAENKDLANHVAYQIMYVYNLGLTNDIDKINENKKNIEENAKNFKERVSK